MSDFKCAIVSSGHHKGKPKCKQQCPHCAAMARTVVRRDDGGTPKWIVLDEPRFDIHDMDEMAQDAD